MMMPLWQRWAQSLTPFTVAAVLVLAGCASSRQALDGAPARVPGWAAALGSGTVSTYAELDPGGAPRALGIVLSAQALDKLPPGSDGHQCFDRNKDGAVDPATECIPHHAFILPLPDVAARRADIPFKWVLLTWNPGGHVPPGVYDVPHFDVHFYLDAIANVMGIAPGPCGPEHVRCDQFETARKALPPIYMHPDFKDVEAVVSAMGNHLIDLTSPEFAKQPFTRTWIYGVYGGKVTFYEEMVALSYLRGKPSACFPIKAPAAFERGGYYPTVSCVRHDARAGEYTVSMERFVLRPAQPVAAR